jgi:succinate dehydrogenase / fumarate reductase cytochrome b subunit
MSEAETGRAVGERPLSPHLTVYKLMLTMAMSMAHRISGAALYLGAALLGLYFFGLWAGPGGFALFGWIGASFVGRLIFFLFVWALFNHLLGGVRHALWDRGLYMDPKGRELLAQGTLVGGVAMTLLVFALAQI